MSARRNNSHSLLDMLATRRRNVADWEKDRAIEPSPRINRHLEEERKEIKKLKKQLRGMGINVDDYPMDEDPSSRRTASSKKPPKPEEDKTISNTRKEEPPNIIWILGLFLVSLLTATLVSIVIEDIYKVILVFIFTLLLLGILLPFIALRYNFLSEARWLKSYIATLEKLPLLDSILKTPENK